MMDIIEAIDGNDLNVMDSVVAKAGNVVAVQLGSLEYAQEFGVDLRFFLTSELQFQNESFKAYLVQRLTESQVNVSEILQTIESVFEQYTFFVGDTSKSSGGLIL